MGLNLKKFLLEVTYIISCSENPLINLNNNKQCDETLNISSQKIKELLDYCYSNSLYYNRLLKNHSYKNVEEQDLTEFFKKIPYLEKENIRNTNIKDLIASGTKGILRETTGSTGIPISLYIDKRTLANQLRARWTFFSWHGVYPGATEGRFWGRTENRNIYSYLKDLALNRRVFQMDQRNPVKLTEELRQIEHFKPAYFYGYSSLLLRTAELYDHPRKSRPKPKVIFSTAEMLTESQRNYISTVFDCPVAQEYGCSEVDIIAFECQEKRYHLNRDRLYTEFITTPHSDYHEIIVTDLDNICTPIIRYKIGDLVEIDNNPCSCGRPHCLIKGITGRTSSQLVPLPNGGYFHAVKFAHIIEELCHKNLKINKYRIDHVSPDKIIFKLDYNCSEYDKKRISDFIIERSNILTNFQVKYEIVFCEIDTTIKNSYYVIHFGENKKGTD